MGSDVGLFEGDVVGLDVGHSVGSEVGLNVGEVEGFGVGVFDGEELGEVDGDLVGCRKNEIIETWDVMQNVRLEILDTRWNELVHILSCMCISNVKVEMISQRTPLIPK